MTYTLYETYFQQFGVKSLDISQDGEALFEEGGFNAVVTSPENLFSPKGSKVQSLKNYRISVSFVRVNPSSISIYNVPI